MSRNLHTKHELSIATSLCYKAKRTVGFSPMAYNVSGLGDVALAAKFHSSQKTFKGYIRQALVSRSGGFINDKFQ